MIVVLMGVAGAGKTTVGRILANDLGWEFHDADDHHPEENVERMASGVPLDESHRDPWLRSLEELVRSLDEEKRSAVLACSALTAAFREKLAAASPGLRYVYLRDDEARLRSRLEARSGHYMKAEMLRSQLETLEEPDDVPVIEVGDDSPEETARRVRAALGLGSDPQIEV